MRIITTRPKSTLTAQPPGKMFWQPRNRELTQGSKLRIGLDIDKDNRAAEISEATRLALTPALRNRGGRVKKSNPCNPTPWPVRVSGGCDRPTRGETGVMDFGAPDDEARRTEGRG
eukprot:768620-Hanusia_phi.AAC.5